jgi:hypothetical protein
LYFGYKLMANLLTGSRTLFTYVIPTEAGTRPVLQLDPKQT